MRSSNQPADAERDRHRRVGLGFNAAPQPFFKSDGGIPRHIRGLPVEILGGPSRLVELTLDLLFDIAGDAADAFFQLASDIAGACQLYGLRS